MCVCVHLRRPTSLDAFVFGFVAPLYKASLPSSPLQRHLRQLDNVTSFCDNILADYFDSDRSCKSHGCGHGKHSHVFKHRHTQSWITSSAFPSPRLGSIATSALSFCSLTLRSSCLFCVSLRICLQVLPNLSRKPRMPTSKN